MKRKHIALTGLLLVASSGVCASDAPTSLTKRSATHARSLLGPVWPDNLTGESLLLAAAGVGAGAFLVKCNDKITSTPYLGAALSATLGAVPMINASDAVRALGVLVGTNALLGLWNKDNRTRAYYPGCIAGCVAVSALRNSGNIGANGLTDAAGVGLAVAASAAGLRHVVRDMTGADKE